MKPLIVYELKKEVSPYLATVNAKNLAQTLVEGYYVLMGGDLTTSVIVALTDVAVTHYFKINLRNTEMLEVEWHRQCSSTHQLLLMMWPILLQLYTNFSTLVNSL